AWVCIRPYAGMTASRFRVAPPIRAIFRQASMTESAQASEVQRPPPPVWEDFVDIYVAPRQVFMRRLDRRYALVLSVLAIVLALLAIPAQTAISSAVEADLQRAMAQAGAETPIGSPFMDPTSGISLVMAVVGTLVLVPLGVFVTGLIIWGISSIFSAAISGG